MADGDDVAGASRIERRARNNDFARELYGFLVPRRPYRIERGVANSCRILVHDATGSGHIAPNDELAERRMTEL